MRPIWKRIPWQRWGIDRTRGLMALGLIAVAMLLWGRLILKNAPRTALADPKGKTASVEKPASKPVYLTREIHMNLPTDNGRDLFAMNHSGFARKDYPADSAPPAKSLVKTTDSDSGSRVLQAAQSLRLETTILGSPPRAVIDGQLVSPGQTIKGFEVLSIGQRQVTLQKDGIQILLEM
ncbi:MAG: hypothetical protein HC898_03300 [Phycisphaerales bacterium]|nr:hypothetical protein [Phycisphaerales bacterium]